MCQLCPVVYTLCDLSINVIKLNQRQSDKYIDCFYLEAYLCTRIESHVVVAVGYKGVRWLSEAYDEAVQRAVTE